MGTMNGSKKRLGAGAASAPGLEEMALVASGVEGREEMEHIRSLLDGLGQQVALGVPGSDDRARAGALFHRLWSARPERYQPRGSFRLNEVALSQLGMGPAAVGNCLGLTVLYNVLAQRLGLRVSSIHMDRAFDTGPHVFSLLHSAGRGVDIENILPDGFDYRGHRGNPDREEWDDRELVADMYLSRGNEWFEAGEWQEAMAGYDRALVFNPRYEKAHLNKMMARSQLDRG